MNIKLSFIAAFILRLLKIFPNNDPLVAFILPTSKNSFLHSLVFILLSVFLFDFLTSGIGIWTYSVAAAYIILGLSCGYVLRRVKTIKLWHYISASTVLILLFDFFTGPILSTFIFGIPFYASFLGQIPFTVAHLISGLSYTIILVPFLDKSIAKNENLVLSIAHMFKSITTHYIFIGGRKL